MRIPAFMVAASIVMHGTAHAQDNPVQRGPAPEWATPSELMPVPDNAAGLVFVRRQDVVIHLGGKGQQQYIGYRFKILHPNALQLGNLSIAWNPAAGSPKVHAVNIYRDGRVIDALGKGTFEILRREDQLEAARLDGVLTAVFRISDLRVGDELEFAATIPESDPTLGQASAGLLMLASAPAAGRYHLGLNWEKGRQPNLKMTPDMVSIAQVGEQRRDFRFDNPASLSPPKDAPARYQWQRIVEYSEFSDWAAISRHFAPLYVKAAKFTDASPLKGEASRILAAHPGTLDRASAALKLVQQDVRYIYVGLNGGNLTPATADETWQRRYGDCKGKTVLLLGLLAEMGIQAEPVLVNSSGADDGLDARLPNPGMFDHVLVRAHIDGKVYWLDGTLPPVAPPGIEPVLPLHWVLPLTEQGRTIEHLDWHPATTPEEITMYDIDARPGFDQPAHVTTTSIVRGIKGLQQDMQLSGLTPEQLTNALRQQLVGALWQTVNNVAWHYDQKAQASIMAITGTWTIDWNHDGDQARSFALPGGGFNPPDRKARSADQNQDLPYANKPEYSCEVTTLRLPSATNAANWSTKPGFDTHIFGKNYYRTIEIRDGSIRMIRGFRVERQEIDAASAKQDNSRIASFDNSMAWVNYDPASQGSTGTGIRMVPATDGIDWTGDTVPCRSIDASL